MATYLILNTVVLAVVIIIATCSSWRPSRTWLLSLVLILVLTLLFDSLIIHFDIVDYHTDKILNIYFGNAPIEDFFYAIAAALLMPLLWHATTPNKAGEEE